MTIHEGIGLLAIITALGVGGVLFLARKVGR